MMKFIRKKLNRKYKKEELIKRYEEQKLALDNGIKRNQSVCGGLGH
ncbi:MAG: hypothetical protein ACFFCV_13785 [Promethearchaeota archaeon]